MLQLRGSQDAGEAVHQNIQCNNCGVAPIRGARFKCTVCHDFDLCDACEQKGEHNNPMLKMRRPVPCRGRGRHGWMRHRAHALAGQNGPWNEGLRPLFRMFVGRGGGCQRERFGAGSTACSAFVSDVTLPDGVEIPVGVEMVKTWKFRNDGKQAWPEGTTLVLKRTKGEFETAPLPISRLPNPGEEVELSATLKALQPGRGRVVYRLMDNNGTPFGKLWADVNAVSREETKEVAKAEPVKTVTPVPAPVTPAPAPQPVVGAPKAEPHHRFEVALTALAKMGFDDRKKNIKLLNKEKGNLERTVERLLDGA
jgi:next-to-BRCA1 protein 1